MFDTKDVNSECLKTVTERGTFEGLLSPYGFVDGQDDVVLAGAYSKNIADKGSTRPLLWQHDPRKTIGQVTLHDRADGLWVKGQLLLSVAQAKDAYELVRAGYVTGLSIGYKTIRDSIEAGVRHLKELVLYECSLVTIPAADIARVTNVKTLNHSQIEIALKSFRDDILRELKGN